jgi:heme A synthase
MAFALMPIMAILALTLAPFTIVHSLLRGRQEFRSGRWGGVVLNGLTVAQAAAVIGYFVLLWNVVTAVVHGR